MTAETTPLVAEDDRLLTPREVAEVLAQHVNTVKRLPSTDLPYYQVGSRRDRRYRLGDVRAYLAARRVGS